MVHVVPGSVNWMNWPRLRTGTDLLTHRTTRSPLALLLPGEG